MLSSNQSGVFVGDKQECLWRNERGKASSKVDARSGSRHVKMSNKEGATVYSRTYMYLSRVSLVDAYERIP